MTTLPSSGRWTPSARTAEQIARDLAAVLLRVDQLLDELSVALRKERGK